MFRRRLPLSRESPFGFHNRRGNDFVELLRSVKAENATPPTPTPKLPCVPVFQPSLQVPFSHLAATEPCTPPHTSSWLTPVLETIDYQASCSAVKHLDLNRTQPPWSYQHDANLQQYTVGSAPQSNWAGLTVGDFLKSSRPHQSTAPLPPLQSPCRNFQFIQPQLSPNPAIELVLGEEGSGTFVPEFKDDNTIKTVADFMDQVAEDETLLQKNEIVNKLLGTLEFERRLTTALSALEPENVQPGSSVPETTTTTETTQQLVNYLNTKNQRRLRGVVVALEGESGETTFARVISKILKTRILEQMTPKEANRLRATQSSHYHKTVNTMLAHYRGLTVQYSAPSYFFVGPALNLERVRIQPWTLFNGCNLDEMIKILDAAANAVEEAKRNNENEPTVVYFAGFEIFISNINQCPIPKRNGVPSTSYPDTFYRPKLDIFEEIYPDSPYNDKSGILLPYKYDHEDVREPQWEIKTQELPYEYVEEFVDPGTNKIGNKSRKEQIDAYKNRHMKQSRLGTWVRGKYVLPEIKRGRGRPRLGKGIPKTSIEEEEERDVEKEEKAEKDCKPPPLKKTRRNRKPVLLDKVLYPPTARYYLVRTSNQEGSYKFHVGSHAARLALKQAMRESRQEKNLQRNANTRAVTIEKTGTSTSTAPQSKKTVRVVVPQMNTKRRSRFRVIDNLLVRVIPTIDRSNASRTGMLAKKIKNIIFTLRRLAIQCDIPILSSIVVDQRVYLFHHGSIESILKVYKIALELLRQKHESLNGIEKPADVVTTFDVRLWTTLYKNVAGEHGSSAEYVPWQDVGAFMKGTTLAVQNVNEAVYAPESYGPIVPNTY